VSQLEGKREKTRDDEDMRSLALGGNHFFIRRKSVDGVWWNWKTRSSANPSVSSDQRELNGVLLDENHRGSFLGSGKNEA